MIESERQYNNYLDYINKTYYSNNKIKHKIEYKHFSTENECNNFILKNKINVYSRCCSNKGYGYIVDLDKQIDIIKDNKNIEEKIISMCCVCFENTFDKTKCNHSLCNHCEILWKQCNTTCPYCRKKI